jgi:hypothetical protein
MDYLTPQSMAEMESERQRLAQRQQLMQAMMGGNYIPDSGRAGVATSILGSIIGAIGNKRNNEDIRAFMERSFEADNQKAQAEFERKQREEQQKFEREIEKASRIARDTAKAQKEFAKAEFTGGGVFDPSTGQFTGSPEWMQQQLGLKAGEARIAAANRAPPADPFADIKAAVAQGVLTPDQAQEAMRRKLMGGGSDPSQWQIVGNNRVNKVTGEVQPLGIDVTQKSDDEKKADFGNQALAQDAINFAAAVTGKRPEEISAMAPEQVRQLVASDSRFFSGPIMGKVPFTGYDLDAYSKAAAGKQARINNPSGPVSNADFEIAGKSVFSQEKPAQVNADLIYAALTRAQGGGSAPQPAAGGAQVGKIITAPDGKRYRIVGGDPNDPDVEPVE